MCGYTIVCLIFVVYVGKVYTSILCMYIMQMFGRKKLLKLDISKLNFSIDLSIKTMVLAPYAQYAYDLERVFYLHTQTCFNLCIVVWSTSHVSSL